jgi:hypothetical protein
MSALPERKKSPGEIARLRETLGVPLPPTGQAPTPADTVETLVETNHQAAVIEPMPAAPLGPLPAPGGGPLHSLKRAERQAAMHTPHPAPQPAAPASAKPVRSLRKSELHAPPANHHAEPRPDSKLPLYRHSQDEIADLHRRDVISLMNAQPNPKLLPAHLALIVPGYLFVAAGAIGCWFYQFPLAATAGCSTAALSIAAFINLRKPASRHHAAFIAVAALFLIIFSALHYFPHLRHAT